MRNRNHIRLTSEGFSFHTLELKYCTWDSEEFHRIFKRLKDMSGKEQFYKLSQYKECCYFCGRFTENGMRIYLTEGNKWNSVKAVINPRRLIEPKSSYLGIMQCDEKSLDKMEQCFTDIMRKIGLPDFMDDWTLTRMDLCVNFLFDRKKLPQQIIKLISRGPVAKGYEKIQYLCSSEKTADKKHSVKYENKRVTLVAYDKAYQAKKENLTLPEEVDTRGILRLELQCSNAWIRDAIPKHKHTTTRQKIDFLSSHSKEFLTEYSNKLLLCGEYCQLKDIKEKIKAADLRKKVRDRMLRFADILSNEEIDYKSGLERLEKRLSDKKMRDLLKHFERLNIAPVPLDKHCKLKSVLSIPSVLEMMGDDSLDMCLSNKKKIAAPKLIQICTDEE